MNTPGFAHENTTKPKITAHIEGDSLTVTPDDAAQFMLAGIIHERYYITNDLLGELARVSVNGGAPRGKLGFEVWCV